MDRPPKNPANTIKSTCDQAERDSAYSIRQMVAMTTRTHSRTVRRSYLSDSSPMGHWMIKPPMVVMPMNSEMEKTERPMPAPNAAPRP
jgi:hypothetical protein